MHIYFLTFYWFVDILLSTRIIIITFVDNESYVQLTNLKLQECINDEYYRKNIKKNSLKIQPGGACESFSREPTIQDCPNLRRHQIRFEFFLDN